MSDTKHTPNNINPAITFHQFKDEMAERWKAEGLSFDKSDIQSLATPLTWHESNLLPFVRSGGKFTLAVCKSIVKNGYYSLEWFSKNFPECLEDNTLIGSGKAAPRRGLLE